MQDILGTEPGFHEVVERNDRTSGAGGRSHPFDLIRTDAEFHCDWALELFRDGKYRRFHQKDRPRTEAEKRDARFEVDADLFENYSHQFLFSTSELPLFWLAGGMSGKWPMPSDMTYLEKRASFTYKGTLPFRGVDCLVLAVQEQASTTKVREFWVAGTPPFAIHCCRICDRDGTAVSTQIEVQYEPDNGGWLPKAWTATYKQNEGVVWSKTYTVQKIETNSAIAESTFAKRLEPGSVVFAVGENTRLEVDANGNLVPLGSAHARSHYWIWAVLALVVFLILGLRQWKRRASSVSP